MIERSGSVPRDNGPGSGRPKNIRILRIRIRLRNTALWLPGYRRNSRKADKFKVAHIIILSWYFTRMRHTGKRVRACCAMAWNVRLCVPTPSPTSGRSSPQNLIPRYFCVQLKGEDEETFSWWAASPMRMPLSRHPLMRGSPQRNQTKPESMDRHLGTSTEIFVCCTSKHKHSRNV